MAPGAPRRGLWPNRQAFPIRWWSSTLIVTILLPWIGLYVVTALVTSQKSPWEAALSVALGTKDPFDAATGAAPVAVLLAVWSWLLVPVGIGALAAILLEDVLRKGTLAEPPSPPASLPVPPAATAPQEPAVPPTSVVPPSPTTPSCSPPSPKGAPDPGGQRA